MTPATKTPETQILELAAMEREVYVPCDIPACNCGKTHLHSRVPRFPFLRWVVHEVSDNCMSGCKGWLPVSVPEAAQGARELPSYRNCYQVITWDVAEQRSKPTGVYIASFWGRDFLHIYHSDEEETPDTATIAAFYKWAKETADAQIYPKYSWD